MKIELKEQAADAFRRRYNRTVTVQQGEERNEDGTVAQFCSVITSKFGTVYILDEFLQDNLTDHVTLTCGDDVRNFPSYLEAEVFVADEIGKET
jgi:hypothetical protein